MKRFTFWSIIVLAAIGEFAVLVAIGIDFHIAGLPNWLYWIACLVLGVTNGALSNLIFRFYGRTSPDGDRRDPRGQPSTRPTAMSASASSVKPQPSGARRMLLPAHTKKPNTPDNSEDS